MTKENLLMFFYHHKMSVRSGLIQC